MDAQTLNLYLNWSFSFLRGDMRNADALYKHKQYGPMIESAAAELRRHAPPFGGQSRTIYRGIALANPKVKEGSRLPYYGAVPTFSFSEDKHVACDFADPNGTLANPMLPPNGYVLELSCSEADVLFHWKWVDAVPVLAKVFRSQIPDMPDIIRAQKEVTVRNHRGLNQTVHPFATYCSGSSAPNYPSSIAGIGRLWNL